MRAFLLGRAMRTILTSVGALLISAAILLAGGGLMSTLVAVRAQSEGFPLELIGVLTSAYFAGFIGGCYWTPYLVKRVGHVRVFAALSALIAVSALTHAIYINVPVWFVLRVFAGFGFAGLYMLIESWINEQAPNETRGRVLSIYRMVDLAAVTTGQFLLTTADPDGFVLFSLVAILICAAIFPVSLSAAKAPAPVTQTSLNLKKLWRNSPLAVVGAFIVGLSNGAFWGIAPVFVQQLDYSVVLVSSFMIVTILAGALLQWPFGYLSDKFGRRGILLLAAVLAAGSGLFLWQLAPVSVTYMLIGGVLYGMFAMQLYGISAAHANDFATAEDFVAISGGLLLVFGIGSVIGPSIAPVVMEAGGPSTLFAYTAAMHVLLAIYTVARMIVHRAPNQTEDFIALPRPRSLGLILRQDPRVPQSPRRKRKSET